MGKSIAHKILSRASGTKDFGVGDIIYAKPDLVMLYDWPGFDGMIRNIRIDPDKVILNIDHRIYYVHPFTAVFIAYHLSVVNPFITFIICVEGNIGSISNTGIKIHPGGD